MTLLRISDHALLRFFERAHGVAVEDFRARIAADLSAAAAAAQQIGGAAFGIKADGLVFVVRGGTVVTVVAAQKPFALMFDESAAR